MSPDRVRAADVSTIRGRWQIPALRALSFGLIGLAVVALVLPGGAGRAVQWVVVGLVTAGPLVRVLWLVHRWRQERDWRFVGAGVALLAVIAVGALLATFAR